MLLEKITEDCEIKDKGTPSSRLYSKVQIASCVFCAVALIICAVAYWVDEMAGLKAFSALFYPILLFTVASLACGVAQALRQAHFVIGFFLTLQTVIVLATIALIIFEAVRYGTVYIVPFAFVG